MFLQFYFFYILAASLFLLLWWCIGGSLKPILFSTIAVWVWMSQVDKIALYAQQACDCYRPLSNKIDTVAMLEQEIIKFPDRANEFRTKFAEAHELLGEAYHIPCTHELHLLQQDLRKNLSPTEIDTLQSKLRASMREQCPRVVANLRLF